MQEETDHYIEKLKHSIHSMENNIARLQSMLNESADIPEYIVQNWKDEKQEIELLLTNTLRELAEYAAN